MGNKTGNITSVDFNPKEWTVTDRQGSQNQSKGNFKILENQRTGELIDQYQLFWPSEEDFRFYLDSYYWRRQEYNIVPSRYIVEQHSEQFCSRSYGAKVYIEHVPTRLSDVTDIPFPDNLYVVLAVLEGYQKLYENVHHYFPIAEDQICVDRDGVVKVWVNSDLSKNYPQPQQGSTEHKDEAHMVDELLNIIWENTDEESQPQSFRQFFARKKGKKRIGFDEAKVIVNQYAKTVSSQIPQKFNSILQMIEESDEYQHTQNDNEHLGYQEQGLQNVEGIDYHHDIHDQQYMQEHQQMMDQQQHMTGHSQQYMIDQQHPYPYEHGDIPPGQYVRQASYNSNENNPNHPQFQAGYQQHGNYQIAPNAQYAMTPLPQQLNPPFIPRQVSSVTGPIITIPPIRGRFGAPVLYQPSGAPAVYQKRSTSQQAVDVKQHHDPIRQSLPFNNQGRQEENPRVQPTSKTSSGFHQHVSLLNPHSGSSQQQVNQYQQIMDKNERQQLGQYSNRRQINNTVGRSLQLANQPSSKNLQQDRTRVNKSQINQAFNTQGNPSNYYKGYNESPYSNNRMMSGMNSRLGDNNYRSEKNIKLQHISEEQLDTKYYTLDTEVELDEEIAADLKKMIMAL